MSVETLEAAKYSFDIPKRIWMNANDSYAHWGQKSAKTKALVNLGYYTGLQWPRKRFIQKVRINVIIHPRTNSRFDPLNVEPTVKGLLDGLVRSGVLVDDDWRHVEGPYLDAGKPIKDLPVGFHRLVMTLTPIGEVEK